MFHRLTSELKFRLRALFRRRAMESELDDELRFHLEREVEKRVAAGASRVEAERLARAHFGALGGTKDDARDARGIGWLDNLARDVRFAARSLRLRKAFTLGVVLTLALGIGVNATMFGIVDRLLFRAPPTLRDPGTVHRLYRHSAGSDGEVRIDRNFAFPTYRDLAAGRSFQDVIAFQTRRLAVGEGDDAREVPVTVASAGYFDLFSAVPVRGRFFTRAEDTPPAGAPVVVLGYEFWQTRFGGAEVIGKTLRVDRTLCTIIGVAPRGFVGMTDQGVPAVYLPITTYAHALRGPRYSGNYNWSWLELVARRKPEVSRQAAETELTAGFTQSWRNAAAMDPGWGSPEAQHLRGEAGPLQIGRGPQAGPEAKVAAWIGGVALIVLLIACANVANLLLSRAVSRRAELGMRAALGASRARLVGQVLTESLLLAATGGAAGLALAQWGAAGLRAWFLPADLDAGVITDGRTLLFTAAATLAAALLTGLGPALQAGRRSVTGSLRIDARQRGYEHSRLRTALLVLQPALSVILLVGAVLFVRSLRHVRNFRLGYDIEPVLLAGGNLRGVRLDQAGQRELTERMLAAAQNIPGVRAATLAASIPFWSNEGRGLYVPGVDSVQKLGRFILQAGTPDYFRTMGTRILRGRAFDATDRTGGPPVAVVSEGMARVLWPKQEAIGRCFRLNSDTLPCITVIGVAEEMRVRSLTDAREFTYYLPAAQYDGSLDPVLLVRVDGKADDYLAAVRGRLQAEMPGAAYVTAMPLSALVDPRMRSWQFGATLFVAFGGLALVVAAVGLYSVMTYDVAQRTRELGVRIALGAPVSRILGGVLARAGRLVLSGIVLGGLIAVAVAPKLESLLFQQSSRDPVVFGLVAGGLLVVGLAAAAAPALRAARVDPNVALRAE